MTSFPRSATTWRVLCANIQAGIPTRRAVDYLLKGWQHAVPMGKHDSLNAISHQASQHDWVALQEADSGSWRSGGACQTRRIAHAAGLPHWASQINRNWRPVMTSGNALLTRHPAQRLAFHPLPSPRSGRGVLWASLEVAPGAHVDVVVVHLALSAAGRAYQVHRLVDLLRSSTDLVLLGDFNCAADADEMAPLFERTPLRRPVHRLDTYPAWAPQRALDHVLVGGRVHLDHLRAVAVGGSDHLGLSATLSWHDPAVEPRVEP